MGSHDWHDVDARHRQCRRCGLRLIYQERQTLRFGPMESRGAEWIAVDANGVPMGLRIGGKDNAGGCRLVHDPAAPVVIIEYTGDPDVYPGCERFMHAAKDPVRELAAELAPGLVPLGQVETLCGWRCELWELGPARNHVGWTWCEDCFPGRGGKRRLEAYRQQHPGPRPLPEPLPAWPALPAPKQRKAKKPKALPPKR